MDTVVHQVRRVGDVPFPHQAAFVLDNPIHRKFGNPAGVAEQLALREDERVLEIGPESGIFSAHITPRIPSGHLDLFDVRPEMLEKVKRKLDRAEYRNAEFRSGDASNGLPFPDKTFDVAFLASVIGEVPDKAACIRPLGQVLEPGGRLIFRRESSTEGGTRSCTKTRPSPAPLPDTGRRTHQTCLTLGSTWSSTESIPPLPPTSQPSRGVAGATSWVLPNPSGLNRRFTLDALVSSH